MKVQGGVKVRRFCVFCVRVLAGLVWAIAFGACSDGDGFLNDRAIAQTAVLSVGSQTAQGTYETGVQRIALGTTQGVNLSFLPTGETIQRVWLNDPSRVVVDFDGCLTQPGGLGGGQDCGDANSASVIHIRQLSERIDFPAVAVSGNGQLVHMTVITVDSSGQRRIYQFNLELRRGAPPFSLVQIVPATHLSSTQVQTVSPAYQQEILNQLSLGLARAESSQDSILTPSVRAKVSQLIALMQSGTPYFQAVRQAQVPSNVIERLRALGLGRQ